MADYLDRHEVATSLEPDVRRDQPLERVQKAPWAIALVLLVLVGWLAWRAFIYKEEGDPVGSAMLAFEKQNSLTVFSSHFEVVAESENSQGVLGIDLLKSRQAAIIPASVEYRLDLSHMDRKSFSWNPDTQTLSVDLPQLRISRPNLDEAKQRVFTEGSWVTRDASTALARNNSAQAERKAIEFAKNPEILNLARSAAVEAVRQNLTIPLQIAGYKDAKVEVQFDGQPTPAR